MQGWLVVACLYHFVQDWERNAAGSYFRLLRLRLFVPLCRAEVFIDVSKAAVVDWRY